MNRRANLVAPVLATLILAGTTGLQAAEPGSNPALPEIETVLRSMEAALRDRKLDAFLSAYDPAETALVARTRARAEAWMALADLSAIWRPATLSGGATDAQAVVFRGLTWSEHDRRQSTPRWETILFRLTPAGWKIRSEEERAYARSASTDLSVEIRPDKGTMGGSATIRVEVVEPGEDSLLVELNRGLEVRSLSVDRGRSLRFEREGSSIVVPMDRPLRKAQTVVLTLSFEGRLFNEAREQGYSQVSIAPAGSFASWVTDWYPHLAGAGSRSRGRITYNVPGDVTVASSGRLERVARDGDLSRHFFSVDNPLDFSFAAARYFHREADIAGTRIGVYLLEGGDAKADLYIKEGSRTLSCERSLYGRYPFDGYAVVEIPSGETGALGGSSEQGMNLFPVGVLPDDRFPLLLLAHEMGHGWWGNHIRSDDGPMISEGLAQVSAVLCLQRLEGEAAMRSFLRYGAPGYRQSAEMYFSRFGAEDSKDYPIGAPAAGSDAAAALHDLADTKGMFVYDMMRTTIGDQAFVRGLRSIASGDPGKKVSLADLRTAWERESRTDLRRFFRQWFERTGAPELSLAVTTREENGEFVTSGAISQSGDPYELSAEIALVFPGRSEIRTVSVTGASTTFSFRTKDRPAAAVLDPAYKILRWTPELRHAAPLADAEALLSSGRTAESIAKLEAFVAGAPDSLEGKYRLGVASMSADLHQRAEDAFRFVLDRFAALGIFEPAVGLSQLHLGRVLDLEGRRDEAMAAYERTLALPDVSGSRNAARSGLSAPFRPAKPTTGPAREDLVRLAGTYDNDKGISLTVALNEGGLLTASQPGQAPQTLAWIEGNRFRLLGGEEIEIRFIGEREISSIDVLFQGLTFHLPKKE